jgi:hypothetical protein
MEMSEFWWGVLVGAGVFGLPLLILIVWFAVNLAKGMSNI